MKIYMIIILCVTAMLSSSCVSTSDGDGATQDLTALILAQQQAQATAPTPRAVPFDQLFGVWRIDTVVTSLSPAVTFTPPNDLAGNPVPVPTVGDTLSLYIGWRESTTFPYLDLALSFDNSVGTAWLSGLFQSLTFDGDGNLQAQIPLAIEFNDGIPSLLAYVSINVTMAPDGQSLSGSANIQYGNGTTSSSGSGTVTMSKLGEDFSWSIIFTQEDLDALMAVQSTNG